MSDNAAPFPQLRTAYLRAVARAWHDNEYMQLLLRESEGPQGALPLLEKEYRFKFPFNVKLILSDRKRPWWDPSFTTGWYGFGDEFTIFLPSKPSPEQAASVLARYYAEFPSFLGAAIDGVSEAPPDFATFGVITTRVLALAWQSEDFRKQLYTVEDARDLVQGSMDYVVPWNFSLKLREAPAASSIRDEYWASFPRSEITLHIPLRPDSLAVEPAALGSYNATGSQYPFSC